MAAQVKSVSAGLGCCGRGYNAGPACVTTAPLQAAYGQSGTYIVHRTFSFTSVSFWSFMFLTTFSITENAYKR